MGLSMSLPPHTQPKLAPSANTHSVTRAHGDMATLAPPSPFAAQQPQKQLPGLRQPFLPKIFSLSDRLHGHSSPDFLPLKPPSFLQPSPPLQLGEHHHPASQMSPICTRHPASWGWTSRAVAGWRLHNKCFIHCRAGTKATAFFPASVQVLYLFWAKYCSAE